MDGGVESVGMAGAGEHRPLPCRTSAGRLPEWPSSWGGSCRRQRWMPSHGTPPSRPCGTTPPPTTAWCPPTSWTRASPPSCAKVSGPRGFLARHPPQLPLISISPGPRHHWRLEEPLHCGPERALRPGLHAEDVGHRPVLPHPDLRRHHWTPPQIQPDADGTTTALGAASPLLGLLERNKTSSLTPPWDAHCPATALTLTPPSPWGH